MSTDDEQTIDYMANEIQILQAQLHALRWIPVEEGLPEKTMTGYLVRQGLTCPSIMTYISGKRWHTIFGDYDNITHWMPIPPLPEEKDGDV